MDYKRSRETVAQDDWKANTFTGINTYKTIEEGGSTKWEQEYDAKGLPKRDDKRGGATKGFQYVFDAWDRMVKVKSIAGATVEELRYNGLGHRIGRHYDTASGSIIPGPDGVVDGNDPWEYFQYNERWQQVAVWTGSATGPTEVFTYGNAGMDGYGGSSYIDDVVCRERDKAGGGGGGSLVERYYYLQNWRNDVVAIMTKDGAILERIVYDAYGRPHSFSPGDLKTSGGADRPDGVLDASDTWTTGSAAWNKDIGTTGGVAIPDGTVSNTDEPATLVNLKTTGHTGGWNLLGDSLIGNRKGLAGYEFDPVLNGVAGVGAKPVYHVRHRVLASDTGKWFQKDPLGYVDGMDLYEYCKGDAFDKFDELGLCCGKGIVSAGRSVDKTASLKVAVSDCNSSENYTECWYCCSKYLAYPNEYENCMSLCSGVHVDQPPLAPEPSVRGNRACDEAVRNCRNSNPEIRYWWDRVQRGCAMHQRAWTIQCLPPGNCGAREATGASWCSRATIGICLSPANPQFCSTLLHELVHAYDCCVFGHDRGNESCCTEIRAYFYERRLEYCNGNLSWIEIYRAIKDQLNSDVYPYCRDMIRNNPEQWRNMLLRCIPSCNDADLPRY